MEAQDGSDQIQDQEEWGRQEEQVESSIMVTSGHGDGGERSRLIIDSPEVIAGDEDNWSQQVETDEIQRALSTSADPSSVLVGEETVPGLAPKREEPTLKEKLVERERQRRVETERARLKRQFALNSNGGGAVDEDSVAQDGSVSRENGSVAGSLGEGSSVAFLDPYDEEGQKLTYPMERFLQEQGGVIEEEPMRDATRDNQTQGVLMERFLKEPVVVETPVQDPSDVTGSNIDRSVSFEMEPNSALLESSIQDPNPKLRDSEPGNSDPLGVNASIDCIPPEDPEILTDLDEDLAVDDIITTESIDVQPLSVPESPSIDHSISSDQPRFLRLTEAEIQEMAAIDEASRSNAPPSDRDDISDSSLVGELISDFGGPVLDTGGTLSQGTRTTAMESGSLISGAHSHSGRQLSEHEDSHSIDHIGTASISSHIVSSTGGSVSVTANPPSDIGGDEPPLSPIPGSMMEDLGHHNDGSGDETDDEMIRTHQLNDSGPPLELQEPTTPEARRVVNRQMRPGLSRQRMLELTGRPMSSPIRRSSSAPDLNIMVDDFDYDKDAVSPGSALSGLQDLQPNGTWSPGSRLSVSPYNPRYRMVKHYATVEDELKQPTLDADEPVRRLKYINGGDPLLPEIPKEIVAPPVPNLFYQIKSHDSTNAALARASAQQYSSSSRLKRGKIRGVYG